MFIIWNSNINMPISNVRRSKPLMVQQLVAGPVPALRWRFIWYNLTPLYELILASPM